MPAVAAGALVFFTSAAVLVLEILAGRLLAPYVGVTLETYTGIIGVVLAGIAAGTWLGGRAADRYEPRRLLGPIVAAGGAAALTTVPLVRLFGSASGDGGAGEIVVLAAVGFFAPAAILSAVSPTVVKLQLRDLHVTGAVVGRLSALGTAGAITGTFLTGFLLVATVPTRAVILTLAVLLVVLGMGLWLWLSRTPSTGLAIVLALAGMGITLTAVTDEPCEIESRYYCVRVDVDPARPSGRILWLDNLRHSYVDLDDPTHLEFRYAKGFGDVADLAAPAGRPVDAVHIGGGGFTMPRYLDATRPGTRSLVLELDPEVVDVGRDQLGLVTGPDLRVREGDARIGIRALPDDAYDVAFGDAFGGLAVPWHLTTREFVAAVDRVLRPEGTYVLNLIDHPPLQFVKAEIATLREVFGTVVIIAPPSTLAGQTGGNIVVAASHGPIDVDGLRRRAEAGDRGDAVAAGAEADAFVGDAPVLRDDYAPVDQWLSPDRDRVQG